MKGWEYRLLARWELLLGRISDKGRGAEATFGVFKVFILCNTP